ncbi:uncharacterized protein LOC121728081 [Aricia agestis]|uniref:uncharacterized protein LOC121728081 n=1 Tax=Aricia agestis TaxID=91739 RepID=UPI001C20490A|nr:uncharacterized protein LOC121728081 [Aricia agestis]
MKYIAGLLLMIVVTAAYDDMQDDHVVNLARNKEAMHQFWGCLTNKNKCDEFGQNAKKHVIESLKDSCRECDATQKHYGHILISTLKDYPELYEAFEKMYDPDRTLLNKLDDTIKKYAKMKGVLEFILLAACLTTASAYKDIDDNYDFETVLKNVTRLTEFIGCFLDKNPCSDVEQHIKSFIADCDDIQRHYARAVDEVMKEKYPEDYEKYKKKYDPEGNHYNLFLKALAKY